LPDADTHPAMDAFCEWLRKEASMDGHP
jgi:hypothetical protein